MAQQHFFVAVCGEVAVIIEVDRSTSLRDLQKQLCRAFSKPFPITKATMRIDGTPYEDFADHPFAECVQTCHDGVNALFVTAEGLITTA